VAIWPTTSISTASASEITPRRNLSSMGGPLDSVESAAHQQIDLLVRNGERRIQDHHVPSGRRKTFFSRAARHARTPTFSSHGYSRFEFLWAELDSHHEAGLPHLGNVRMLRDLGELLREMRDRSFERSRTCSLS